MPRKSEHRTTIKVILDARFAQVAMATIERLFRFIPEEAREELAEPMHILRDAIKEAIIEYARGR